MKIAFLDAATMGNVSFEPFESLGEFVRYDSSTPEEARERVRDLDVLLINKVLVDKDLIDSAPDLKLICIAATGVTNIDVEYAASKGIPVRNAVGYSTDSVVQSTFMHILSLVGGAPYFDDSVKSGSYSRSGMFTDPNWNWWELSGKTIGIIGLGNIGKMVAHIAEAFGMKVCYFSTSGTGHCKDYPCLELDELLKVSDIVSIHAPLNDRTMNLIGREQLALMKPTAYLVNMGRGAIVIGLAAVIIGEAIFGKVFRNFALRLFSVALGSILYYLVLQAVIWMGIDTDLLKLLSALVVAVFLAVPYWKAKYFNKPVKRGNDHAGN